ncbi:MAG: C39 family peptidase [Patescibacteria group bacterium]
MNKIIFSAPLIFLVLILSGCGIQPQLVEVSVVKDANQAAEATPAPATAAIPPATNIDNAKPAPPAAVPAVSTTEEIAQIPRTYQLKVLFAQQAPFANWDAEHEEACEEASMIMADRYFSGQPLDEKIMEAELQKLFNWEADHGYQVDLTAQETVDILRDYFGRTARLSTDVSADQIKYELAQGRLIIIPAAGRELGNPNFKQPGPIYHMLVIKGYNDREFITNDPGTRKGNSYVYAYSALINAIHNWNPILAEGGMTDSEMAQGRVVLVVVDN